MLEVASDDTGSQDSPLRPDAETLRKLRFLAELPDGTHRQLFKLILTDADTSFYILPYGPGNRYHVGVEEFGVGERQKTFSHRGQVDDDATMPKLSLHRSGCVRVHIGRREAGRLQAAPFSELRGQHIATVRVDGLSRMPVYTRRLRTTGSQRDLVTRIGPGDESLRVVIGANSLESSFAAAGEHEGGGPWVVPVYREAERLYIGLFVIENSKLSDGTEPVGSTVIAGWDARRSEDPEMGFVRLGCY